MFALFSDPWTFFWLGLVVVLRNFGGAFPEPDPNIKSGFGSGSPGYRFIYQFARAMTLDLKAIGVDSKAIGAKFKTAPPEGQAPTTVAGTIAGQAAGQLASDTVERVVERAVSGAVDRMADRAKTTD